MPAPVFQTVLFDTSSNSQIDEEGLTIKLKGTKDITPYVNNVKILLGGEI